MFITIDGKKQAFTAARVKRMHDALHLVLRGLQGGNIKATSVLNADFTITSMHEIIEEALK